MSCILAIAAIGPWIMSWKKRRNSTVFGLLDEDPYRIAIWMREPNQNVYHGQLDMGRNSCELDNVHSIVTKRVGPNDMLILRHGKFGQVLVPYRLAKQLAFQKFIVDYLAQRGDDNPLTIDEESQKFIDSWKPAIAHEA